MHGSPVHTVHKNCYTASDASHASQNVINKTLLFSSSHLNLCIISRRSFFSSFLTHSCFQRDKDGFLGAKIHRNQFRLKGGSVLCVYLSNCFFFRLLSPTSWANFSGPFFNRSLMHRNRSFLLSSTVRFARNKM